MIKKLIKSIAVLITLTAIFAVSACSSADVISVVCDKTNEGVYTATGTVNRNTSNEDDGHGDGSSYSLRIWCAEEDEAMIRSMLKRYENKYSANTYNFTVERRGEDIVSSQVLQDVSAAADIFSFANDQLGALINGSALTQIPSSYTAQIEEQIDVARLAAMFGSNYYAIPYSYENCFLYYNKSKINDVSSIESIVSASIPGVTYNLGIDMGDSYYTTMFLYTAGVEIFGPNGNDASSVNLDNEYAYKACRYIQSLGSKTKLGSVSKADQTAALKTGQVAAMISGPHMISSFKSALGDNFAVAMLPKITLDGKQEQLVSFSGVKMYGISRKDTSVRDQKTTDEAIKLAAYLSNTENQEIRLEQREFCPTDAELFFDAVGSGIDTVEVVVQQSDYSKLKPGLIQMSNYWESMQTFLLGVYKLNKPESTWSDELKKVEAKLRGE